MKGMLVLGGSVIVGNYVAERFILKSSADDKDGFIPVTDGLGLDDVARALTIVLVATLAKKFIG